MSLKGSAESYTKLKGEISLPEAIQGQSAYEIALLNGFEGTEAEWLESLTEQTKQNAAEVIAEANTAIDRAKAAENEAVEHIESMAEQTLNIVQTTGDSETAVMSQKAVTAELDDIRETIAYQNPLENYYSSAVNQYYNNGWNNSSTRVSITLIKVDEPLHLRIADGYNYIFSEFDSEGNVIEVGNNWLSADVTLEVGYHSITVRKTDNSAITLNEIRKVQAVQFADVNDFIGVKNMIESVDLDTMYAKTVSGILALPTFIITQMSVEGGNITWKWHDKRIGTKDGEQVYLTKGDRISLSDYTKVAFFLFYSPTNESGSWVGDNNWHSTDYTIENDGYYHILIKQTTEVAISDVNELLQYLTIRVLTYDEKINALVDNAEKYNIPSYWQSELNTSVNSIKAKEPTIGYHGVSFFFITDIHWRNSPQHSGELMAYMSDNCKIPLVVCGGDIINDYARTEAEGLEELKSFYKAFDKNFKLFSTVGNHDYGATSSAYTDYYYDKNDLYPIMLKNMEEFAVNEPSIMSSYYDNLSQKVRYIQFERDDYSDISSELAWVDARITELDSDWTVILFFHNYFEPHSNSNPTIGTESVVLNQHFTNLNKSCEIACMIVGHCHSDAYDKDNGILVISSQCDRVNASNPYCGNSMTYGTNTEHAFDCFQVDTLNKKIYVTRIGAGNDRVFDYDTNSATFGQIS